MGETRVTKNTKKPEVKLLPAGATVLSKDISVDVEEIENGYLITKRTEVKFTTPKGGTDWNTKYEKFYSKEDPLTITTTDASLADAFDEG